MAFRTYYLLHKYISSFSRVILEIFAQLEIETTSERTKFGLVGAAKKDSHEYL